MRTTLVGLSVSIAILVSGCTSIKPTGNWKNPDFSGDVGTIYIVGISKDNELRQKFEDHLKEALDAYGVEGLTSHETLTMSKELTKEMVDEALKDAAADALLLTRVTSKSDKSVVYPTRTPLGNNYTPRFTSSRGGYQGLPNYYRGVTYGTYLKRYFNLMAWETRQVSTRTYFEFVILEISLFDSATEELIWSAEYEATVEPNTDRLLQSFIEKVAHDLDAEGLI